MSYIIQNDKVIGKTRELLKDDLKAFCCLLPDSASELKKITDGLIRKRDDVMVAVVSNDARFEEEANKLCYFAKLKSKSIWSAELLLVSEPPF